MRKLLTSALLVCATTVLGSGLAHAWFIQGQVVCAIDGSAVPGVQVQIASEPAGFAGSTSTAGDGGYVFYLPDSPGCYIVSLVLGAGQTAVNPASGTFEFCTTDANREFTQNFTITTPSCGGSTTGLCWLTAGGAKFSSITGTPVGQSGPQHSWGGNVYPGCSPTAGDGGDWNHIAFAQKLHFHGRHIVVDRCGNIDGIPPGSTSPATPFNYIEFHGTGTLVGIQGNKADYGTVYFWAHCEDRNEPGSSGQRDGAGKDRYFLHVFSNLADPNGSTLLLVDIDGNPATVDPVTITDGNMQIHISSCSDPALAAAEAASAKSLLYSDRASGGSSTSPNGPASVTGTSWGRLKTLYR
ncbi:MAG: carboxypeptidase regulatory-like domain-containing protein [Candidatus Eisenbacteria bacterium]|uniref:Carboxypeptidase regulatory-like domain-containing protein n=1 Tax=Eiseniibacteriota bacterium TaxID=2212470 RepID=A0A9D6LAJ4_UNCEI|nr:carboxypeptidase regulatory-like domain-containing protein [Candidatus Eisenbacteria bacterium]MBI3539069.1 carboxypeptidase regulatory-like domain-containing protein [Candidatus Eisenbacteria bacterium]